ncbi:hypothetical protein GCM10008959_22200 [Deinococcus seoulensis]|uniref:DUF4382 domain-containing protein n=1 Tax=Deinococcus seoulensis TaxID=1837379 RepID=A0ABQ2RTH0_9DEIO|nr:hypothetical protein GCM10008959_22200 [Deinococcus seoulensis]
MVGAGILGLVGCVPTSSVIPNEFTDFSDAQQAAICAASPRVGPMGILEYGTGEAAGSVPPDYTLNCPDLRVNMERWTVTVWAPTLNAALAAFVPEAEFLTYYADLRVRVTETQVSADPIDSVPEPLLDEVRRVTVTVTPLGGAAQPVLRGGVVTPVTLEPGATYRIDIRTDRTPNPWPSVTLDPASGTVQAQLAR